MTHSPHIPPAITPDGEIEAVRAPARERYSWALYDFSNTIFSMNIATLFFAVWLVSDLHGSLTMVALGNGISSAMVALSIPLFGAISDVTQKRKPWVVWSTLAACGATVMMGVIGQTAVPLVGEAMQGGDVMGNYRIGGAAAVAIIASFIVANYAYQGAQPFYNAMMPELVPQHEQGRLSGIGTAFGYVGSILGILMVLPFFNGTLAPGISLPSGVTTALRSIVPFTSHAGRVSVFVPTALLFLLFSLPLFFFCRDHNAVRATSRFEWRKAFADVAHTVRDAKSHPGTLRFILASFLYQDAIGTIIAYMALYAVKAMGFEEGLETTLLMVLTLPAVIGSFLIGRVVDRIGPKRTLLMVIAAWVVLLIAMILVPTRAAFWIVGAMIGLIFGGVPTAERPLLLTLVPDVESGRFFSLMVLSSRAAAIVGPFIWAFTVDGLLPHYGTAIAYRAGVVTVTLGMIGALILLWPVPDKWKQTATG
jgi:UMF1 family MFS transporter